MLAEKQIRQLMFGLLSNLSSIKTSGMTRFHAVSEDELPFLSVYSGDEEIEYVVMGAQPIKQHTLSLSIEVIVASESQAEDILSDIFSEIVRTVENDIGLQSFVLDVSHVLSQRVINESGSVKTIFGTVFFDVVYRTREGEPDLILEAN